MAKNAEERYQNALGLKHDLTTCLHQWQQTGKINFFDLGSRDISDRFIIPEKLYGRKEEVKTLLAAFDRVAQGKSEIMMVAGFSGIGKTAVVKEVHKPIVRQRGYFIKGKFDQFQRNIPLGAFVQAFRDLMGQLIAESDAQIKQWKTKILSALQENAQVIIEVIPEELSVNSRQFQNCLVVLLKIALRTFSRADSDRKILFRVLQVKKCPVVIASVRNDGFWIIYFVEHS